MKRYFYDWLFFVILWLVITLFFNFVSLSLIRAFISYTSLQIDFQNDPFLAYMISNYQYLEAVMFGLLFGTASFGINIIIDNTSLHKLSYGKTIILKTLLYFIGIVVIFFLMAGIIMTSGMSPLTMDEYQNFLLNSPLPSHFFFAAAAFFIMSSLLVNFIALVNKKFGPGHMFMIFLGKYNHPVTENRIFMFLDLKDSTTIAEQLGHIIYSKMLQQCFMDLNKLIPDSGAEIYQYVGDEAVLTWKIRHFEKVFNQPVQLFYAFKSQLEKRSKYYTSRFGLVPQFKAGINAGLVTVAEIGEIKKEIAYHGDVVNTASRLRSACNEFQKQILTSEFVVKHIKATPDIVIEELGEVKLKGKKKSIVVFSIEKKED